MGLLLIFVILLILMLSILAVVKVNDIQSQLEEVEENKDETIQKLKELYKKGLLKESELNDKKRKHKRSIHIEQLKQYLQELHNQKLLSDEELDEKLEQLDRVGEDYEDVMELREQLGNDDVVCLAKDFGDEWLCVCGVKNDNHENPMNCTNCYRSKEFVLDHYQKV